MPVNPAKLRQRGLVELTEEPKQEVSVMDALAYSDMTVVLLHWALLIGSFLVLGLLVQWDQRNAIEGGIHVKSKPENRHLYLASEEPACALPPKHAIEVDPYNAMYDEEFSYPENCSPIKPLEQTMKEAAKAKQATLKKAA